MIVDEQQELAVTNALSKFSKLGGFTQSMDKKRQSKSTAGTTMDLNKKTKGTQDHRGKGPLSKLASVQTFKSGMKTGGGLTVGTKKFGDVKRLQTQVTRLLANGQT